MYGTLRSLNVIMGAGMGRDHKQRTQRSIGKVVLKFIKQEEAEEHKPIQPTIAVAVLDI